MAKKKPRKKYSTSKSKKKKKAAFWLTPSVFLVSLFALCLIFFSAIALLSSEYSSSDTQQELDDNPSKQQFIVQTAGYAKTLKETYGILPSISISQAILESDWGRSELSVQNNNFYGIKGDNPDKTVMMNTKEYVNGEWIEIKAPFRKYDSWQESMDEHARLIVYGTTWNEDQYATVLSAENYKEAAYALEKSGYATDPDYPVKLIQLIEEYNLNQYD
ncbi:glycoside hydrolase family 73 protein [Carnobacterium sp.]|uniref:glycoside hydrolase family 73 protein n=1 Tax=Carnobacterium sp. TaxID=48221 RepID=UPI003C724EFC